MRVKGLNQASEKVGEWGPESGGREVLILWRVHMGVVFRERSLGTAFEK